MAPQKHLRIGVYVPIECQMFDVSPVDLLGMLDPSYLTAAEVPSSLIALGVPSTIEYISLPSTGAHISLTANAFLRVSKTTQDVEVQPGQLDILLVPGPNPATIFEEEPLAFLRGHAEWKGKNGERTDILSVCSGCCLLAQSGILKGKAASGPRPLVPRLRKDFPDTKWVEDKRWVADGNIWSSGELAASSSLHLSVHFILQRDRKLTGNV